MITLADIRLLLKPWQMRRQEMSAFSRHRWFGKTPEWEEPEIKVLQEFFKGPVGQKLITHLYAECHEQDRAASLQTQRHEHAAGWACGYRASVATIQVLSAIAPTSDESEDETSQVGHGLEHLTT